MDAVHGEPPIPMRALLLGGAALSGFGLALSFWLAETAIHVFFFHGGSFWHELRPETTNELWMRSFTSVLFALAGILVQAYIEKLRRERDSLRMLARAVEQAGESILLTDRKGRIEYANPAFERITGYALADVLGKTPRVLGSGLRDKTFYREMWRTIDGGEVWRGRVTDRRKDGGYYPLMLTIAPVLDERGRPSHFVGIQTDLTRTVELEDALAQAQKMEFLGAFASGVAHDFNNVLTLIQAQVDRAQRQAKLGPATQESLRGITRACGAQATAIRRLLSFVRSGQSKVDAQELPLRQLWREMEGALRLTLPRGVRWSGQLTCPNASAQVAPGLLLQAMQNLVSNAGQAARSPTGGRIEVRIEAFEDGSDASPPVPALAGVRCVRISVHDDGPGVPDDLREKIFEPFFSTKAEQGTGLGLASAAATARECGGVLRLAPTALGEGATFELFLRRGEDVRPSATAEPEGPAPVTDGGGRRVLLAEDQAALRSTTRILLESVGYRVVEAADGEEALDALRADAEPFDVVALDVGMAGLRGPEAARQMRSSHPDLPILFLTGFDDGHILDGFGGTPTRLLTKPYSLAELTLALAGLTASDAESVP